VRRRACATPFLECDGPACRLLRRRAGGRLTALLVFALAGCQGRPEAAVHGVPLAQARGVIDEPDGELVVVTVEAPDPPLPAGKPVKLAIARQVPWNQVAALLAKAEAAGVKAVPLVGNKWRVRGFVLSEPLQTDQSIAYTATSDGKSCVSPPGEPEAKCVQTIDKDHIDVAYTRELVREAVDVYKIQDVDVQVPSQMQWQDVVRAIDAARTCCGDTAVRVKLDR
jgi:hypothetical protein